MGKVKATCAIITNERGELLLIKRGREPFSGYWALISGIGESLKGLLPEQAVQGEVDCDLQTVLLEPKLLFEHSIAGDEKVDGVIVFTGKVDESKIKLRPPYSLEYAWFGPDKINGLGLLAFENNEIIKKYLMSNNQPGLKNQGLIDAIKQIKEEESGNFNNENVNKKIAEKSFKKFSYNLIGLIFSGVFFYIFIYAAGSGPGFAIPSGTELFSMLFAFVTIPLALVFAFSTLFYLFKYFFYKHKKQS